VQHAPKKALLAMELNGQEYLPSGELAQELGISRQTLWRWRKQGKVPAGHKYRDGQILFTTEEVSRIREYAYQVEPVETVGSDQLRLFK
jgi:transposase-like protein